MGLVQRVFTDDDHLAYVGWGAVVACAWYSFAAGASQLVVVRLVGMVLAHPSDAAAHRAVLVHRLT